MSTQQFKATHSQKLLATNHNTSGKNLFISGPPSPQKQNDVRLITTKFEDLELQKIGDR